MTSLPSTATDNDNSQSAPNLLSISHDMAQVLTGVRHVMETSATQDHKLLDIIAILTTQTELMKERDQTIMIMQSKIDSQQAIIEEIRCEQRLLSSFLQRRVQDVSVPPSLPIQRSPEPEPVTFAPTPEKSSCASFAISSPEPPAPQPTSKLTSDVSSDTNDVAHVNLRIITVDDPSGISEYYTEVRRPAKLQRQGAFYGTPNWHAMAGVRGSGAPPPSPSEIASAQRKARADGHKKVGGSHNTDAAPFATRAAASGDDGSTSSSRSCKRCRDPAEQEARTILNPMLISSIVHDVPDKSPPSPLSSPSPPGHSSTRDDDPNGAGPVKRRRLSQDSLGAKAVRETKCPNRRSPRRHRQG